MSTIILLLVSLLTADGRTGQPLPSFELSVRGAGSRGSLIFGEEEVAFTAADPRKSRRWAYRGLKQVRIVSPRRIVFETFEDRSMWRLGADRSVTFDVTGSIDGNAVAFLLDRLRRPVMSAVLPANAGVPIFRTWAKHSRGRKGTHGVLTMFPRGLAYESTETASFFWRFADIHGLHQLSPYSLLVDVYTAGAIRPFAFELKVPLTPDEFDQLWQAVHPAAARAGRQR